MTADGAAWTSIVNPRAGGGVSSRRLARLRSELSALAEPFWLTERAGHAAELAERARQSRGIIVGGGDGTIFEVLQVCHHGDQRMAVLPLGRGNSLARDLGVARLRAGLDAIAAGVDRRIDLMEAAVHLAEGGTRSLLSASNLAIGYPAAVASAAGRWRRAGSSSYAIAALLTPPRSARVRVVIDDRPQDCDVTGIIVSQSRYVGPFLGFPRANLGDGLFDVMLLRASWPAQMAHNASSWTRLRFFEPATTVSARHVRVMVAEPALLKIDGETIEGVAEVDVRVRPRATIFRTPA
jgi:diacylglycerol kinase family enzyme